MYYSRLLELYYYLLTKSLSHSLFLFRSVYPSYCCRSLRLPLSLIFRLPLYPSSFFFSYFFSSLFYFSFSLHFLPFFFSVSAYLFFLCLIIPQTPLSHLLFLLGDYGTANINSPSATCMCGVSSGSSDSKWQQSSSWKGTGVSLPINLLMKLSFVELAERMRDKERDRERGTESEQIYDFRRNYGLKGVKLVL